MFNIFSKGGGIYSTEDIIKTELYLGDCLVGMEHIPDKSIDLIICDLPYG